MVFLSSWNFAANLAAPFFAVYMLKTLGYAMTTIIALTMTSQLQYRRPRAVGQSNRPVQQ